MFNLLVVFLISVFAVAHTIIVEESLMGETVPDIISRYGYISGEHTIRTDDGYLLTIHRLQAKEHVHKHRRVVFMVHGVGSSSAGYVLFGAAESPGFYLARLGYDVWMGNLRGNRYSAKHVNMANTDPVYWDFGIHEMATIDLPGSIDYILRTTQEKSLVYLGHSMGTLLYYAMLSEKPEYNSKVDMMFGIGACAFYGNISSIGWISLEKVIYETELYKILPSRLGKTFGRIFDKVCSLDFTGTIKELSMVTLTNRSDNICLNFLLILFGYDAIKFDELTFKALLANFPNDISLHTILNLFQMYKTGNFQKFDYGAKDNLLYYGRPDPPQYNLKNVHTPLYLFHGLLDDISNDRDLDKLSHMLPADNIPVIIEMPGANHVDYLVGKKGPSIVVSKMHEIMQKHRKLQCHSRCVLQMC